MVQSQNKYNTFFHYNEWLSSKTITVQKIWDEIQEGFNTLKEWYEDYELYHTIGYLIVTGDKKRLVEIYNLAKDTKDNTKSQFKAKLIQLKKQSLGEGKSLADFSYDQNREETKKLLLLFNVETICQSKSCRFDFVAYKKENWSLEHIHAQNSEKLPPESWDNWINEYKPWIENFKNSMQANKQEKIKEIEEINTLIEKIDKQHVEKINENDFTTLQDKVLKLFSDNEKSSIHSIDNLALLITNQNSALNNAIFPIKRKKIIEFIDKGKFIAPCTKNVFQKCYTPSDAHQIFYWGQEDRKAYKKAIAETLKKYGIKEE